MRPILIIMIFQCITLVAAPKSSLWDFWDNSNEINNSVIEYSELDDFLNKYSKKSGENVFINYSIVTTKDRVLLENFISRLSKINIRNYNKKEQKCYWVNLYNSLTIDVILEHYPVDSILDIKTSGFFKSGPWDEKIIEIENQYITLNDIEHRILRPIWNDKRIHYVLNCASIGCPNIGLVAYNSENMDESLDFAEQEFLNSNKGVNTEGDKLILSSIFKWYRSDFARSEAEVLEYISSVRSDNLIKSPVKYTYDWDLNEFK